MVALRVHVHSSKLEYCEKNPIDLFLTFFKHDNTISFLIIEVLYIYYIFSLSYDVKM